MMNAIQRSTKLLEQARRRCLALPEVTEGSTYGAPTCFVRRRSFAKFVDPVQHPRLDEDNVWRVGGRATGMGAQENFHAAVYRRMGYGEVVEDVIRLFRSRGHAAAAAETILDPVPTRPSPGMSITEHFAL